MTRARARRILGSASIAALIVATVIAQGAGVASAHDRQGDGDHHHHHHDQSSTLYVSPTGQASNAGGSCDAATYSTIQSALDAAAPWATVIVCQGAYNEDVIVSSPVSLYGQNAVITGTPNANGTCDQIGPAGPTTAPCLAGLTIKSSDVTVSHFIVQSAVGEGILATGSVAGGSIDDVQITQNIVINNDTGGSPPTPNSPYPQCSEFGQIPGDCGEGVHLMGVRNSHVEHNYISGNSGGVLLTDELGPTHDNEISGNVITKNLFDCGVTAPGHNPNALDSAGNRQPDVAGVYDNEIRSNFITDNGTQGEGAGVLFANAGPGTASYNNKVENNYLAGNELAGVTMHAHTVPPGQFEDLSGNQITGNMIGTNNVGGPAGPGDPLDGPPAQDFSTTGVTVFSGSVPVQVSIDDNMIVGDHFGVWLGVNGNVNASTDGNLFANVDIPVFTFS